MATKKCVSMLLSLMIALGMIALSPVMQGPSYAAAASVRITFNSQGGSTIKGKTVQPGAKVGALKTPTNAHFSFKGWYTKPSGGSKISKSTKVSKDTTYFAQWKLKSGYVQATFKASGYSILKAYKKSSKGVSLGANATKKITREGYTFKGWYTKASGGTKITKTTKIKKNTTYYAQWTAKPLPPGTTPSPTPVNTSAQPTLTPKTSAQPPTPKTSAQPTPTPKTSTQPTPTKTPVKPTPTPSKPSTPPPPIKTPAQPTPTPTQGISPTGVKISLTSGYRIMPVTGGTCTLAAAITPSGANKDTAITWSSDKTSVATVDASGKVTAKGAGDATITAATANGKKDTYKVRVGADVTSLSFNTDGQPSGAVKYDMKAGQTMPMYLPKIMPANAYSSLTFTSSNTGAAEIVTGSSGDFFLKSKAPGSATITAKSHNGKTAAFTVTVKPALTGAAIPSSRSMDVNTYWNNIPVTLTPASGAYIDYVLTATDPNNKNKPSSVLRIEQNKNAYAISPGQARIRVTVDGVEKSSCLVTVNAPPQSANLGMKYYNVEYESSGKATVSLGIVPVANAAYYVITEHVKYTLSMQSGGNPGQLHHTDNIVNLGSATLRANNAVVTPSIAGKRYWILTSAQIGQPLKFTGVDTGLRFYSVAAYRSDGATQIIGLDGQGIFVGRVPVLYYPRSVGGTSQSNADGVMAAFSQSLYFPSVGNFMLGGDMWLSSGFGTTFLLPTAPWALALTFDQIPGASGYEIAIVHNGTYAGTVDNPDIKTIGSNRREWFSDFIFDNGETIAYIFPYVTDIDNTRSYGEMRTVIFDVQIAGNPNCSYWENSGTLANPVMLVSWK